MPKPAESNSGSSNSKEDRRKSYIDIHQEEKYGKEFRNGKTVKSSEKYIGFKGTARGRMGRDVGGRKEAGRGGVLSQ